MRIRPIFLAFAAVLPLSASGCATPKRLPAVPIGLTTHAAPIDGPIRFFVARDTKPFEEEARTALLREQGWLQSTGRTGPLPAAYFLAVSGGSDNGAFGAGFLNGWTATGKRPEFKVVTGVSTGALIAPFAFLGPKYDYVLERVFTNVSQKNIFKQRGLVKGVLGDAMADSRPLAGLVAQYADRTLLDAIAAEYRKGRILLVGTCDFDALEPVIWNMTALAASPDPRAIELFRSVLLASASIPGAFPPVMINVSADGKQYQEMHVDGGTLAQVFLYPPSFAAGEHMRNVERKRTLYIIRNARLDPEWASTQRSTIKIAVRAIDSLTRTQGIGDLYRIYATAQRDGIDFNLASIPPTFTEPHGTPFDTGYMRKLFAVGREAALAGYDWQKFPPGFNAARRAEHFRRLRAA